MLLLQRHAEEKIPREVVLVEYPTQRKKPGSLDALRRSSRRTHLPEALSPSVAAASDESLMNKVPQAAPSQLHQPSRHHATSPAEDPP